MSQKIYVGNLSYTATQSGINDVFSRCGTVLSVAIINDKITGKSKGFGFVEMSSEDESSKAISQLNGTMVDGRPLKVSAANPIQPSNRSGGSSRRSSW